MEKIHKLNNKMYFLLVEKALNQFTMQELRLVYCQYGLSSGNGNKDREFLYRQLFMLEEKGLLTKEGDEYARNIRYSKSDTFSEAQILPKNPETLREYFPEPSKQLPEISELKVRLHEYQVKFAATLGQTEEYRRLLIKFPHLREEFTQDYRQTRDDSSRYSGKIQVLRKVISSQSACEG